MFIILFQKKYEIALLGYTQSDLDTIRQTLELASVSCAASIETSWYILFFEVRQICIIDETKVLLLVHEKNRPTSWIVFSSILRKVDLWGFYLSQSFYSIEIMLNDVNKFAA